MQLQNVSIENLTEARILLETDVIRLAVRRVEDNDIEELEKWILRGGEQLGAGQLAIMENINFHLRLAEVTKNPILCIALSSIMNLLVIFFRALPINWKVSQQVTKEHYEMRSKEAFLKWTEENDGLSLTPMSQNNCLVFKTNQGISLCDINVKEYLDVSFQQVFVMLSYKYDANITAAAAIHTEKRSYLITLKGFKPNKGLKKKIQDSVWIY
ncbi:MAG: FadR/GntR family transcriptional regulator [Nitrospinales bacterium]